MITMCLENSFFGMCTGILVEDPTTGAASKNTCAKMHNDAVDL